MLIKVQFSAVSGIVQKLNHHWIAFFDNVTYLSDWQSNCLCRACTGEGFSKRQLFTDDEDIIYTFKRCVGLNGINVVATKPDLLDRSVILELERIEKDKRKPESVVWAEFDQDKAAILGGIFDVLSKAIAIRPTVQLLELPRMADFALWGYAIAEALGYSGKDFIRVYDQNIQAQNREALKASVIGDLLLIFMEDKDRWEGTAGMLLRELEFLADAQRIDTSGKTWPKTPNTLSRRLNELKTNLQEEGILLSNGHDGTKRFIIMERLTKINGKANDTNDILTISKSSSTNANNDINDISRPIDLKNNIYIEKEEEEYKETGNIVSSVISLGSDAGGGEKTNDIKKGIVKVSLVKLDDRLQNLKDLLYSCREQPVPDEVLIVWHSRICSIPPEIAKADLAAYRRQNNGDNSEILEIEKLCKQWEKEHHENINSTNYVPATIDIGKKLGLKDISELQNIIQKLHRIVEGNNGNHEGNSDQPDKKPEPGICVDCGQPAGNYSEVGLRKPQKVYRCNDCYEKRNGIKLHTEAKT